MRRITRIYLARTLLALTVLLASWAVGIVLELIAAEAP